MGFRISISRLGIQDSGYIPGLGVMPDNGLGKWASGFRIEVARFRTHPRALNYAGKWPRQMGFRLQNLGFMIHELSSLGCRKSGRQEAPSRPRQVLAAECHSGSSPVQVSARLGAENQS